MKLEVERFRPRIYYRGTEWVFYKGRLELCQIVPWFIPLDQVLPFLSPGDNIRLDGEPYHVTGINIVQKGTIQSGGVKFVFFYKLERGYFTPSKWVQVTEDVEVEEE